MEDDVDNVDIIKRMILKHLKPITFGDEINVSLILEEDLFNDSKSNENNSLSCNENDTLKSSKVDDISCKICNKTFTNQRYLERHSSKHTTKYACPVCCKTFSRKNGKIQHIPRCKKRISNYDKFKKKSKPSNRNKDVNRFFCEKCSKTFTRKVNYDQHVMVHKGVQVTCQICQKPLSSFKSYQRHQKIHDDSKLKISCQYCSAEFSLKSNLLRHIKLHQNNTDSLICCKCNKNTKTYKILEKHKNNETISCTLCSDLFCLETHLKQHVKLIHSSNLWFKCKECPTSTPFMTRRLAFLQTHVKKHHSLDLESSECYKDGWYLHFEN